MSKPTRWEYNVVLEDHKTPEEIWTELDQHGANGWELVCMTRDDVARMYVFKRPARPVVEELPDELFGP